MPINYDIEYPKLMKGYQERGRRIEELTDELVNVELVAKDRYCEMQQRIEELEADNERLRAALEWIATKPPPDDAYELRMLAREALDAVEEKDND